MMAYRTVIEIRDEEPGDVERIRDVNRRAFGQEEEGRIVDALRRRQMAQLSLVAADGREIVGHIMFSPVTVGRVLGSGLGPMAVLPGHQRRGIGSQLVVAGIERLRYLGCPFVVVLGHPAYYPRFGFRPAAAFGLTCEWDVPPDTFMVYLLGPLASDALRGVARYPAEFSTG